MGRIKKQKLMLCAKILLLVFISFIIIISGHGYTVISELKLKITEINLKKANVAQASSLLESDTKIKKEDLRQFLIFTENSKTMEELVENESLKIDKEDIYINRNVELPPIYENDCDRLRCIQIKKDFKDIPSSIWKGLLGTEDFRFLDHRGVDPTAIIRALVVDILAMKFVQGGSTLTQQLMKNLFLSNERNLSRKIREMIYALYIENIMAKEEIITLYLNEMFWGTFQGVYIKGFFAASLAYFGKPPKFLTEYESTILVSLLKGPGYYNPLKGVKRIQQRTNAVFKRLQSVHLVSKEVNLIWNDQKWLSFEEYFKRQSSSDHFKNYYLISQNVEQSLEPFEKFVFHESVSRIKKYLAPRVGDADIAVKAIIGSKNCENYDCKEIFSYYSKFEREKRSAITNEFHQIGSLFKPIVYDSFISLGRSYDEIVSTKEITLNLKSGPWKPKDYSKAKEQEITLKKALQKSKNIPLIRVASEVGFDNLEKELVPIIPRLKIPLGEYPSQLLGAIELSLEEVYRIYGQFINKKCETIKESGLEFEKTILFYMSVADETTISKLVRGPLKNAYIFGKTGTSNNGLDNWYFAFDGKQIYVIWYGVETNRDKYELKLSGAVSSFLIFQNFINNRGKQISEIHCD